MADSIPNTPPGVHEVPHSHTPVSHAFRGLLRAAHQAVTSENDLELAGGARFDPALAMFQSEADEAWSALDAALETVLSTPNRRAADRALKQIAQVYQLCLSLTDYGDMFELYERYIRHSGLFRVRGATASDRAVNALIDEADTLLNALFALERFGAVAYHRDDDPDPTTTEALTARAA